MNKPIRFIHITTRNGHDHFGVIGGDLPWGNPPKEYLILWTAEGGWQYILKRSILKASYYR